MLQVTVAPHGHHHAATFSGSVTTSSRYLACGDTTEHVVEFRHNGNRRLVWLVPVHAASALWLPACAAVLSAPSQQPDDAAYGRHTCFRQ